MNLSSIHLYTSQARSEQETHPSVHEHEVGEAAGIDSHGEARATRENTMGSN